MDTIYADSLFALNMGIDYLLLLCSAKVCGVTLHRWRYALAAALGGIYAVFAVLPWFPFLTSAPIKLASAGFMVLIAFGGERRLLRCGVIFLAVSAAFGGAVWAITLMAGADSTGHLYIPLSARTLALSFAVCYAAVSLVFRRAGKTADEEILELSVTLSGKTVHLRALRDTGNALHDPISGRAVAIAEAEMLAPLFPGTDIMSTESAELMSRLSGLPGLEHSFRLIPYSSVGGSGLLAAFLPDEVTLSGKKEKDLLIAISPARLSESGRYTALI